MRDAELPYTHDVDPGDERHAGVRLRVLGYVVGLALAVLLTATSFFIAGNQTYVWQPSIPIAIIVLAIAQMGAHLVSSCTSRTGPDNTNNVMALAFGLLIVLPRDLRIAVDHGEPQSNKHLNYIKGACSWCSLS